MAFAECESTDDRSLPQDLVARERYQIAARLESFVHGQDSVSCIQRLRIRSNTPSPHVHRMNPAVNPV